MQSRDVAVRVEFAVEGDVSTDEVLAFVRDAMEAHLALHQASGRFMYNGDVVTGFVRPAAS